jgi:anaerobic sulfite reductase subunit A
MKTVKSYKLTAANFNRYLKTLADRYLIYAPAVFTGKGPFTDTDCVRYREIKKIEEVQFEQKSAFSAKEVLLPITQTLFYFTEDQWLEPKVREKKILLFLRSCDIHALQRLDEIYLKNGDEDPYYKELRSRVKVCLMECLGSYRNCFCVSMNTNITDEYDMFVRVENGFVYCGVKDSELLENLQGDTVTISPRFIMENPNRVTVPEKITPSAAKENFWQEYSARCIGCGRCNFVCPTCSCFSMQDLFYKQNANAGERRRVWSSCMVDGYTDMAGGHAFRKDQGERMRFRVMHKIYDFKKRFGYSMCVGCGRCDDACPEYISFSGCINKLHRTGGQKGHE